MRAEELIEGRPELIAAIRPLLAARNAVEQQVSELDRKVMKLARRDAQVRRFMTVPGVGPITALAMVPRKQAGHMTCTRPQAERQNLLAMRASSTHDPCRKS